MRRVSQEQLVPSTSLRRMSNEMLQTMGSGGMPMLQPMGSMQRSGSINGPGMMQPMMSGGMMQAMPSMQRSGSMMQPMMSSGMMQPMLQPMNSLSRNSMGMVGGAMGMGMGMGMGTGMGMGGGMGGGMMQPMGGMMGGMAMGVGGVPPLMHSSSMTGMVPGSLSAPMIGNIAPPAAPAPASVAPAPAPPGGASNAELIKMLTGEVARLQQAVTEKRQRASMEMARTSAPAPPAMVSAGPTALIA
jgi:hypothetical protein